MRGDGLGGAHHVADRLRRGGQALDLAVGRACRLAGLAGDGAGVARALADLLDGGGKLLGGCGHRMHAGRGLLGSGGRSEEHTSELQSLMRSSYAVFSLKNKYRQTYATTPTSYMQREQCA